jgi:membrane-bound lytic murein transglycosylase B
VIAASPAAGPAIAQDESGFQAYLQTLARQAAWRKASPAHDRSWSSRRLTYNARVVELDRQQPETAPNAPISNSSPIA